MADGKCIYSCSEGCSNCVNNNGKYTCDECYNNYFLKEIGEGKKCERCPNRCKICSNENNCTECEEGYKLIDGICNYYCTIGSYSNCKTCDFSEKNRCKDCNTGYYLPNNSSTQSYCSYCGSNSLSCYGSYNNIVVIVAQIVYHAMEVIIILYAHNVIVDIIYQIINALKNVI